PGRIGSALAVAVAGPAFVPGVYSLPLRHENPLEGSSARNQTACCTAVVRFDMRKTLFLQAPSFEGFDGGAGSRYQAKREIRSFWYPTWLAQPAALVEGSKLIDAPPHGLKLDDVVSTARDFDLAVLHTSAPSFASDVKTIEALQ